ncbi:MAG TPA: single-stranded DNA-binding protein [Solirubrobacterales bacterium]|nr:single-stranded DNA-binding protein [Solirubrobacterales bacterium]
MQNVNVVVITGNLTRDPKLRTTESGTKVCNLRVAVNGRRKNGNDEYVDKPNYFNVSVWGKQGERCAEYLAKGRPVAVEGRLDWKEQGEDDDHREYVQIVANIVQFLGGKPKDGDAEAGEPEAESEDNGGGGEDDIPF